MKITIATGPIFPVPAVRGGAVQRLWEGLAREFAKRGHEVTIFAREFPGQASEETVNGIRYVRRGGYAQSTSIKRDLVQCLLYALKTARHVPPGDVVVTNDFWMPAVLPWLKPSAGKVVPCLQRFPKNQGRLYVKCAALAAVSQAVAEAVKVQSPSVADKVVVVPNAIDSAFLKETQSRGDRGQETGVGGPPTHGVTTAGQARGMRHKAHGQRPVRILYVGRIHPEKGLGLLANALRLLASADKETKSLKDEETKGLRDRGTTGQQDKEPEFAAAEGVKDQGIKGLKDEETEWECVLVGPVKQSEGGGGEAFAEELTQQVKGLPVQFEAPVYDPAALAKIYDQADVFVYPSVAEAGESFGIAPLEAMARGLVPVVSDLAVFREYLEPGVNGMVFDHRSHDPAASLASVLDELVADAGRREQLGVEARVTAECFSTGAIADKYLQLFARLV